MSEDSVNRTYMLMILPLASFFFLQKLGLCFILGEKKRKRKKKLKYNSMCRVRV